MFKFSKKNLYDRCGAIDVPMNIQKSHTFNNEFSKIGEEKLPIINFNFQSGVKFTRSICLKTLIGYIPIENITKFKDIFKFSKYCHDKTEWSILYDEEKAPEKDKNQVKKLSLTLKNHWSSK